MKNIDKQLRTSFDLWLPMFDKRYDIRSIPISQRPYWAAVEFIKTAISDFKNTTIEVQLNPPWFDYWYENIYAWYKEKYGKALENNNNYDIDSFIIINNIVYQLKIPSAILTPKNNSNKLYWLIFPNKVQRTETPFSWIQNGPNPEIYNFKKVRKEIVEKVNLLRKIQIYLLTTLVQDNEHNIMLHSIPIHFRNFSNDLLTASRLEFSNSIWEMNLVVEKAIKVYLNSKNIKYKKIHDIYILYDDFCSLNPAIKKIDIKYLPPNNDAIKYRYGELIINNLSYMNHLYLESLKIVNSVLSQIKRDFTMNNFRILIKNPFFTGKE
jgi:hypothetical protein